MRTFVPKYIVGGVTLVRDSEAPAPGRLLLLRQPPGRGWGLPAGLLRRGEAPIVGAARELAEESGITVDPRALTPAVPNAVVHAKGWVDMVFELSRAGVDHRAGGRRRRGLRGGLPPDRRPAAADRWRPRGCSPTTASDRWSRRTTRPAWRGRPHPTPRNPRTTMADLCAVVLAAGEGQRLRPLTDAVPKALCPVGNVPLLDLALARVAGFGLSGPADVAVNASYLGDQVVAHVGDRAHLSVEPDGPLGTSGGIGNLRDWIGGRGVLVGNADAYLAGGDPRVLLDGWDGETVRLLGQPVERHEPDRVVRRAPVRRLLAAALASGARPRCRHRPSSCAPSGGPPRRPASSRWSPSTASSSTRVRHATTWPPTCTRPAAATWSRAAVTGRCVPVRGRRRGHRRR